MTATATYTATISGAIYATGKEIAHHAASSELDRCLRITGNVLACERDVVGQWDLWELTADVRVEVNLEDVAVDLEEEDSVDVAAQARAFEVISSSLSEVNVWLPPQSADDLTLVER